MTTSPLFENYFEVFALTAVLVVSAQTGVEWWSRCTSLGKAPINVTGLAAAVISLIYSIIDLDYWFSGLTGSWTCGTLQIVNGAAMGTSNALVYLHLFLKADASNRSNREWKWWRLLGMGCMVYNWAALVNLHSTGRGKLESSFDGPRCRFTYDDSSFDLKWIAALLNQVVQAMLFCYPLVTQITSPGAGNGGPGQQLYKTLVFRAIGAATVATVYAGIVAGLAVFKSKESNEGTPFYALEVLGNALNLAVIYYAVNVGNQRTGARGGSTHNRASTPQRGGSPGRFPGRGGKEKLSPCNASSTATALTPSPAAKMTDMAPPSPAEV